MSIKKEESMNQKKITLVKQLFTTIILCIISMSGFLAFGASSDIQIVSWNIESDGSLINKIVKQIADFQDIDLWGLSEVPACAKEDYIYAAKIGENSSFKGIMSEQGKDDRLMIIYNSDRFKLLKKFELKKLSFRNRVRPALVGLFQEKESGKSFYFMVNHLYRSDQKKRMKQSKMLKKWAMKNKEIPIIMVGDYNYDWDIASNGKKRDRAFDILISVLEWIEPENKILTQCSARHGDEKCKYNSILDFIFVNSKASKWTWKSKIIALEGEFFPANEKSDHRPVMGSLVIE
jgi:endonuclease/exonuclease/phosphatase family metal-dependent hydrolase